MMGYRVNENRQNRKAAAAGPYPPPPARNVTATKDDGGLDDRGSFNKADGEKVSVQVSPAAGGMELRRQDDGGGVNALDIGRGNFPLAPDRSTHQGRIFRLRLTTPPRWELLQKGRCQGA